MSVFEGALLLGATRPPPTLKYGAYQKKRPEHASSDSVPFDDMELCNNQTSEEAVKALTFYLSHMVSLLTDPLTSASASPSQNISHNEVILTGIITAIPDIVDNTETSYWEMLVIESRVGTDIDTVEVAARELILHPDKLETVLLYPRGLQRFTGVYPGAVLRVKGEAFKFDVSGQPTSVGVTDACFPQRPPISWGKPNMADSTNPTHARIHCAAGPFPRRDFSPIVHSIKVAAQRGANVLICYGPFVPEVPTKDATALVTQTFEDTLNSMFDLVEATLTEDEEVKRSSLERVYFVPSLQDINNFPVFPQPKFAIAEGCDQYKVVANPATITVGGITLKCANYPSVDMLAETMMERWHDRQRLIRAGECLMRDRLLIPFGGFPSRHIDLKWLQTLKIMDDLEFEPPHAVIFSSKRDQSMAFITHSDRADLADPADGSLIVTLATAGRKVEIDGTYNYQVVEITIPDITAAASGGLGEGRSSVVILNETCKIDLQ